MNRLIRKATDDNKQDEKDTKKPPFLNDKEKDKEDNKKDKKDDKDDKDQKAKDNDDKNNKNDKAPKTDGDAKNNDDSQGSSDAKEDSDKPNPPFKDDKKPTPHVAPMPPFPAKQPPEPMTPPGTLPGAAAVPKGQPTLDGAKSTLEAISDAADNVADAYLNLFTALTDLYNNYPGLYTTMKMTARFPSEGDTTQVDQMRDNLKEMINMYLSDDTYLAEAAGIHDVGDISQAPSANPTTPSLKTDAPPDPHAAPGTPSSDEPTNSGDDEGLPQSNTPSKFTPGMSPSSKQPFTNVYHNSSRLRGRNSKS